MGEFKNKCPVCGNEKGFYITASGSDYVALVSHRIGGVSIIACSECGCIYASAIDRKRYKKFREEG